MRVLRQVASDWHAGGLAVSRNNLEEELPEQVFAQVAPPAVPPPLSADRDAMGCHHS